MSLSRQIHFSFETKCRDPDASDSKKDVACKWGNANNRLHCSVVGRLLPFFQNLLPNFQAELAGGRQEVNRYWYSSLEIKKSAF